MLDIVDSRFLGCKAAFIASLAVLSDDTRRADVFMSSAYKACVDFACSDPNDASADSIDLVAAAHKRGEVGDDRVASFSEVAISSVSSDDEIQAVANLLNRVSDDYPNRGALLNLIEAWVFEIASGNFDELFEVSDVLSGISPNDDSGARDALRDAVKRRHDHLDIDLDDSGYARELLDNYDVNAARERYCRCDDSDDSSDRHRSSQLSEMIVPDGVDDLFDMSWTRVDVSLPGFGRHLVNGF